MAACIKLVAPNLPTPLLVFLRCFIGLCIVLPLVIPRGLEFLKTPRLKSHLLRSVFSLCAMSCFFFALAHVGLAEATLLNSTSPIFIGVLAMLILGEHMTRFTMIALIVGFAGVALILKPGTAVFTIGAIAGLASAFFIACAKILIRHMADTEPVLRTLFYFSLLSSLYSSIPLLWFWQTPAVGDVLIMVLAGAAGTVGQLLLTYAFTHNNAVMVAPFSYVIVLVAAVIGWIGWQELPDPESVAGALLVVGACLSMTFHGLLPDPWKLPFPNRGKKNSSPDPISPPTASRGE